MKTYTTQEKFDMLVKKGIDKFIKKPIKNAIAKKWVKKQQIIKKQSTSYKFLDI